MSSDEVQFPQSGDQLFKFDTDWQNNACINWQHNNWNLYARGYKNAADILCVEVIEKGRGQDSLVYPIVFNYRHYVELNLKEILRMGFFLFDIKQGMPTHHKLEEIWSQCVSIAERIFPEDSKDELRAAGEVISSFSFDPQAIEFRYPETKNGERTLESLKYINIRNLYEVMGRLSALLDGINCGVTNAYKDKCDYISEMRRQYRE